MASRSRAIKEFAKDIWLSICGHDGLLHDQGKQERKSTENHELTLKARKMCKIKGARDTGTCAALPDAAKLVRNYPA